jgi:hypothetical protein
LHFAHGKQISCLIVCNFSDMNSSDADGIKHFLYLDSAKLSCIEFAVIPLYSFGCNWSI